MPIVTTTYRPKRAPRKKRKQPPVANRIVTPPKLRPIKGPVIRLNEQAGERPAIVAPSRQADSPEPATKRSAIGETKRKRSSIFGDAEDMTPEEHRLVILGADALFRDLVRKATKRT